MITIYIEGLEPTREIVEQIVHRGAYKGQAITARTDSKEWRYIWTGTSLREPVELEKYLYH